MRWGKFSYVSQAGTGANEGETRFVDFRHDFACFDPATDPYKPAPSNWLPTAADNAAVLAFAKRYFAAFDAADASAGMTMLEPGLDVDARLWLVAPEQFRTAAGTGSRTFSTPAWEINPETASHPGAYAVVTFHGIYSGLAIHCGYLMLYRADASHYALSQQQIVTVSKADAASKGMSQASLEGQCPQL